MSDSTIDVTTAQRPGVGIDGMPRPSEDRVAVTGNAVVLLDGATAPARRPHRPSVTEYVDALLTALTSRLSARPHGPLPALLADAIAGVAARTGLIAGDAPSSTVAIARWDDRDVDVLVLADSPAVLFTATGTTVVSDDRIAALAEEGRLRDEDDVDRLRNRDGGFWVAEAEPAAAEHAVLARIARANVSAVLLASDGVSAGVERYSIFSWDEALRMAATDGPRAVLDAVHAAERDDPDHLR